ncbi:MAG: helix-turn-helix transcriptional regulator [Lachnospiraceae bacterium]|nr:helix-turn-helix transcriptional regulator [Lachnospiraceae bacterium]
MTQEEMIAAIIEHTNNRRQSGQKCNGIFGILQTKWYARVLFELCKKSPLRFGEMKREIPEISNVVLTSTLRALEELKLIDRVQFNEIPPHVEYSLTESGKAMLPIFYEMIMWEKKYIN